MGNRSIVFLGSPRPRHGFREPWHGKELLPRNCDTGRDIVYVEPRPASLKFEILGFNDGKERKREVRTKGEVLVLEAEA